MARPKGSPKLGGRKKGTPNKVNAALKDMILGALHAEGGQQYLQEQARANPNAFLTLIGKVLPTEVTGPDGGEIGLSIKVAFVNAPARD